MPLLRLRFRRTAWLRSRPDTLPGSILGRPFRSQRFWFRGQERRNGFARVGDHGRGTPATGWLRLRHLETFTPPLVFPDATAPVMRIHLAPGGAPRSGSTASRPLPVGGQQRVVLLGRTLDERGRAWYRIRYCAETGPREGYVDAVRLRGRPRHQPPASRRGLYLLYYATLDPKRYDPLLQRARRLGLNTLVVDIQPRTPPAAFMARARALGFYLVGRVVVFPRGLARLPVPWSRVERVLAQATRAVRRGFAEVQLDYIRFADREYPTYHKLSVAKRIQLIIGVLRRAAVELHILGARLGADLFGRVVFTNRGDRIGQGVAAFARHCDVLYPMLYPSHFYGHPKRQNRPHQTVLDGIQRARRQAAGRASVVAFLQAFQRGIPQGLSLRDYILRQLRAARSAGGAGFVLWHPSSDYEAAFQALERSAGK